MNDESNDDNTPQFTGLGIGISPLMEWQPIETAPKGPEILAYDDGAIFIAVWIEGQGWWDHGIVEPPPTHWMPLPDPPVLASVRD